MRNGHLRGIVASLVVCLVALLVLSGIPGLGAADSPRAGTRQTDLTLKVGGQDEMKTRNLLPSVANDVWTSDVHYRAYHTVLLTDPDQDKPLAYIAKGVDFDEDGMFEASEYNVWAERANPTSNLTIVVYYDFNGVLWHDDTQMTPWDLLFSFHVNAQNARFVTDLRVLFCSPTDSYESCSRQLSISLVAKNWEGEGAKPGSPALRVAVEYRLNEPFALFYDSTLYPVMMPMHEWSRTYNGRHADFGCAVWIPTTEATAKGIPECGTSDSAKHGKGIASGDSVPGSKPYDYPAAEGWTTMTDADLIGNGPFKFQSWIQGVESSVVRNDKYYRGVDPNNANIVYDPQLAAILKLPVIDRVRFLVYRTTTLGVLAVQGGDVDFYHWNVGAEFVPDLIKTPGVAVESNAEPGFFYMGYNFRRAPWGYLNGDPNQGDPGYWLRQAFSHVIDKKSIVQNLLQNFGVVGHGTVSPANTFWYNPGIPKPEFDLAAAAAILDSPASLANGTGPDPPGTCSNSNPAGCRLLPRIGNGVFEILTPQADYDPVRASAGAMIASAMNQVGINAKSRPTAFGEIVARTSIHDFDVYILGWRIGGTDPDYLYSFFHSDNAAGGQNYVGFMNAAFDLVVDKSRAELDRNTRQGYIFQAQQILAEERPYDVLYFRTNIEGYRSDRFVDWRVQSGTIWGFWSLQLIHPPVANTLRINVAVRSSVAEITSTPVTVTVFDTEGTALAGAFVTFRVDPLGSISPANGTTDGSGRVAATISVPDVDAINSTVLRVTAIKEPTFPTEVVRTSLIQIFPTGVPFLSILTNLPLGDRVTAGTTTPMEISVFDTVGNSVGDADVDIATTGGLTPDRTNGKATEMASIVLTAGSTVGDVTVTVRATKASFATATDDVVLTVASASTGTHLCPDGRRYPAGQSCPTVTTPGLEVLPILAGIGIAALVAGAVAERKRRS